MKSRTWKDVLIGRVGWLMFRVGLSSLLQPPRTLKTFMYSLACASIGFASCKVAEAVVRVWPQNDWKEIGQ